MSSRRLVAYLMFIIAAGMLCNGGAVTALVTADTYDFGAYYYAGRAVLNGQNPYVDSPVTAQAEDDGITHMPFIYSPLVATLFVPLALLPFGVAARLAVLLQLAALVAIAYLLAPYLLRNLDGDDRLLWAGFGALLLGAYHPAGYVLRVGQITFIIVALILLSLRLANQRRDMMSGVILGVGLVLKPTCAPLLLYYLLKRKWAIVAGAGLVLALAVVVGMLAMGVDLHREYLTRFTEFNSTPKIAAAYQNTPAFWNRLLAWEGHSPTTAYAHLVEPLSMVGQVLLLLPPVVLLLLRPWRKLSEGERLGELSLLLIATVLSAKGSGMHTMVYALPGLLAAVVWLRDTKPERWWTWALAWGVAYCLLALEFQYRAPGLEHGLRVALISSKLAGGLILWALLLRICAPTRTGVTESCV